MYNYKQTGWDVASSMNKSGNPCLRKKQYESETETRDNLIAGN